MSGKTPDQWFAEYSVCHQNGVNKAIHWVCVPAIAASLVGMLWSVPLPWVDGPAWFNWAMLVIAASLIFYIRLSLPLAIGMALWSAAVVGTILSYEAVTGLAAWVPSAVLFVVAWVGQFIGHKIEGKKPAFFQDLQFLLIGPVWLLDALYRASASDESDRGMVESVEHGTPRSPTHPRRSMSQPAPHKVEVALDTAIEDLATGAGQLRTMTLGKQRELVEACVGGVARNSRDWVEAACTAKRISVDKPIAAEEILGGPASLLRYLCLLSRVFRDIERSGQPTLPGKPRQNTLGRTCVPVLPVGSLYDSLIFLGLQAEVWLQPDADGPPRFSDGLPARDASAGGVAGVLGAGNVSAIPATDTLYKIFHDRQAVLLKLNPVNAYLEPFLADAFRSLIGANLLRIVRGGRAEGEAVVQHPRIDTLHITGSHLTHDAIVWGTEPRRKQDGRPRVTKPITSELGNVTPWIIVPGRYTKMQLRAQAEHVVASIVNNASFNCVATKVILAARDWPQRAEFLDLIESLLQSVPPRFAYYPGAHERFERAAGKRSPDSPDGSLPWTLIRDARPDESPHLFEEESFVCVCAETALDESAPAAFLHQAVDFVNERLFGTLCATLTLPAGFRKQNSAALDEALARLRYGSVCINQWSGVVYGLMTPPWGGYPGATISSPQSGIGHVHNTFSLQDFEKTVLWGPLCNTPKPVWFHSHRNAHRVGWALLSLYKQPSLVRLPSIFYHALRG